MEAGWLAMVVDQGKLLSFRVPCRTQSSLAKVYRTSAWSRTNAYSYKLAAALPRFTPPLWDEVGVGRLAAAIRNETKGRVSLTGTDALASLFPPVNQFDQALSRFLYTGQMF